MQTSNDKNYKSFAGKLIETAPGDIADGVFSETFQPTAALVSFSHGGLSVLDKPECRPTAVAIHRAFNSRLSLVFTQVDSPLRENLRKS